MSQAETKEGVRTDEIRAEIRTAATPEAAWSAWADARTLAKWFMDDARGEARPGTTMTWVWRDFGLEVPYEVMEAEPGRRLVLSTPAAVAPPGVIEITIARDGGETVVTIVNSGFLDAAIPDGMLDGIRSGWVMALALMKEYLERHAGQERQSFLQLRPTSFPLDRISAWYTEESLLARWLTVSGAPGPVGATTSLVLRDGNEPVPVRTIARTPWEVAFVAGDDTVVELKAFAAGPGQSMVGVRGTSWQAEPGFSARLRGALVDGVERLAAALESDIGDTTLDHGQDRAFHVRDAGMS